MALYSIKSLNYASSGARRGCVNLDLSVGFLPGILTTEKGSGDISAIADGTETNAFRVGTETERSDGMSFRNVTYVLDAESMSKTLSGELNTLIDSYVGTVNPMYDLKDVTVKSFVRKQNDIKNPNITNDDSFVDSYAPSLDSNPLGFCRIHDRTLMLTEGTARKPHSLVTDLEDNRSYKGDVEYGLKVDGRKIEEIRYERLASLRAFPGDTFQCSSYQQFLSRYLPDFGNEEQTERYLSVIQAAFHDRYRHGGVKYGYVLDIDQSDTSFRYEDGSVRGQAIPTKSSFGQLYSQTQSSVNVLQGMRKYIGIGSTGGAVYLKYYDNLQYSRSSYEEKNGTQRTHDSGPTQTVIPFQKVESLKFTRNESIVRHKSNLFSINLTKTGLEDGYVKDLNECRRNDEEPGLPNVMKTEIQNAIREIVQNITPANTQLFKVFFKED